MFVSTLNDSNNGKVNNSSYFFYEKKMVRFSTDHLTSAV